MFERSIFNKKNLTKNQILTKIHKHNRSLLDICLYVSASKIPTWIVSANMLEIQIGARLYHFSIILKLTMNVPGPSDALGKVYMARWSKNN